MTFLKLSALLVCAVTLAACSNGNSDGGTDNNSLLLNAGSVLVSKVQGVGASEEGPAIRLVVTRDQLNSTPGEVMEAEPDNTGLQDFLQLVATRSDSTPGKVEVWKSSDGLQIILREGVLVGTKGLGGDIRSASAAAAIAGFDGQGGGGERLLTVDRLDGTAQTIAFSCDMTQLGRETLQIVDQRVSTFRMREDCVYNHTKFSNEYWVETSGGRMRKSHQWAGPEFGYITLTRLKS